MLFHTFLFHHARTSHLAHEPLLIEAEKNPFIIVGRVINAQFLLDMRCSVALDRLDYPTIMTLSILEATLQDKLDLLQRKIQTAAWSLQY